MSDWIGKTLGQYEIIAHLGRGGMSTVYRARQASIGREVAIKVISERHESESPFLLRFQREVKIIAELEHIHILPIYDFGQVEGYPYLVMRYLDGGSLNGLLRQRRLESVEIERFVGQICSALEFAHSKGVIHRDMKPHNVLLDRQGNAYLCDFGIAKTIGGDASLTREGEAVGTPSYMAPEQWQGLSVSAQTDVYSVGVMLYELIIGEVPFQGDNLFALMYRHLNEAPRPVSMQRHDIPPSLDGVIERAMRKLPAERFETIHEFADAVRAAFRVGTHPSHPATVHFVTPAEPTSDTDGPTEFVSLPEVNETFGGRTWILDSFARWLVTDSPMLYMFGPHGIGKSTIAKRFTEQLGPRVMHYEFDSTQVRSLDPRVFVETLIMQLAAIIPAAASPSSVTDLQNALTDPTSQFDVRVLEPISREREPIYLVLDGLNAALDQPNPNVTDLLRVALEAWPEALRMVITSTPHPTIDTLFRRAEHIDLSAGIEEIRADLQSTLSTRFATLLPNLSRGEVDLNRLIEKSEGNPLYLNTVFDHLALKRIAPADLEGLPVGLNALYENLTARVAAEDKRAVGLLHVLAVARAPLSEALLARISGEAESKTRARLQRLLPLARVAGNAWTLAHSAIRYWLLEVDEAGIVAAHLHIAEALDQAPFDEYALQYVPIHFALSGRPERAYQLLTDLAFLTSRLERYALADATHDFTVIGAMLPEGEADVLESILTVLRDSTQYLSAEPESLFGQLYARFIGIPALAHALVEAAGKRRSPWLRLVWPLPTTSTKIGNVVWRGAPVQHLSVDGSRWLASCADGYLRYWENGTLAREWPAHLGNDAPSAVMDCAIRERLALSVAEDGTIRLWDVVSGDVRHRFRKQPRSITGCALSADTTKVLTSSEDRLLRLWDTLSGGLISSFSEHPDALTCCAFANDDAFAVSGSVDGTLRVYKTVGFTLRFMLKGHKGAVTCCASSAPGIEPPLVVSGATDGQVLVWNMRRGAAVQTLKGATGAITQVAMARLSDANQTLVVAAASQDGAAHVWNIATGEVIARFAGHHGPLLSCAIDTQAGNKVMAGGRDGSLNAWELSPSAAVVEVHGAEVRGCAFSGDSSRLLTASLDRDLRVWDAVIGRTTLVIRGHTAGVTACAFSGDGHTALSASTDKTLRLWDAHRGNQIRQYIGHGEAVTTCALSTNPIRVAEQSRPLMLAASGSADRTVRIWDVEGGQTLLTLKGHRDTPIFCVFSPSDAMLASIGKDRTVRLWALDKNDLIRTLEDAQTIYTTCAFSPDGRLLLLGHADGKLSYYDRSTKEQKPFASSKSSAAISACGFSGNGRSVFATNGDGFAQIWDFSTGQLLSAYRALRPILSAALAPDGSNLALGDDKGGVTLLRFESQTSTRRKASLL